MAFSINTSIQHQHQLPMFATSDLAGRPGSEGGIRPGHEPSQLELLARATNPSRLEPGDEEARAQARAGMFFCLVLGLNHITRNPQTGSDPTAEGCFTQVMMEIFLSQVIISRMKTCKY